ncbi:flavodoxin [Lentilactobacillus kosonis]|uniref:Flavodoxin n=1 Tax=Lentilactobacillus kosonis TaxID=2810561 RepID=A0A401FIA3_9LACO|nr:flavodoxin [Lentilactobacillus kosonis]GAY72082.1 flavodoxin [Lentilactobacillus kosonis]
MAENEWQDVKSLVLYFSLTGNTEHAAEQIQEIVGGDMQRIVPINPYPDDFNDYMRVAKHEMELQLFPPVATTIPDLQKYDVIFIGYPTWWSEPPRIIDSVFDKFEFAGKKIIVFSTSSGTPFEATQPHIKQLIEDDQALMIAGFRCDGDSENIKNQLAAVHLTY